ncbi:MAG: hypothetical protein Ta2E_05680 [Mycoplasmoidaceae bacterium]|nr:MAG: hypothetical protein Ta2E_05680 [Mycoplasmoidaceae bacterium]
MKKDRKIKCIESPCKKLMNGVFVFEDIIDKEKVRKKMKQTTREGNSNKAPVWFKSYVDTQEKFNKQLNDRLDQRDLDETLFRKELNERLDRIEKDVSIIKKDVCVLKEKVSVLEKDVRDIKEDVDNIVKKNKLKR